MKHIKNQQKTPQQTDAMTPYGAWQLITEEQLKASLEKVKDDSSLQESLKAAADFNAVLAIAKRLDL